MSNKQTLNSPGVIIKSSFYDSKHEKRKWMTSNSISSKNRGSKKSSYYGHLDYVGRKTEAEIIKSERTLGYLEYQNQEFKITSSGHFTQDGIFSNSEMKEEIQNNKRYQVSDNSLVWSTVISFSKEFFESNHIISKEDGHELVSKTINSFFERNHIDPKSMTWVGQFHVDTPHHFHIHLRIHQHEKGHFNRYIKKDEWRSKGKWSKKSLAIWREEIETEAIARTAKREKWFSFIGPRDKLKYEVIGTFKDSNKYKSFAKLAWDLKRSLPEKGRLQYNSKQLSIGVRLQIDKLTNMVINSNSKVKDLWNDLQVSINDPIDKFINKQNISFVSGKRAVNSAETIRGNKKREVYSQIANQVIKLVKENDWSLVNKISSTNSSSSKLNYAQAGFAKSRNRSMKQFSKKSFWSTLKTNHDVKRALNDISIDLQENIRNAKEVTNER